MLAMFCKMYQAGLKFIMIIAVRELWDKKVYFKYSIDKGIYAEFDKKLSDRDIEELLNLPRILYIFSL